MRGVALLCTLGVARAALTAPPPPPASSLVKPPPAAAVNYGAETRSTYTADASRLHSDLLVNYNRMVAPRSVRLVNYSNAGTDVMVQLRFFKVESIQQREGRMRIRVWWRSSWSDLRLAWDPAQYGDVRSLKFGASDSTDSENSEIWLPDIQAYNGVGGNMHFLEPAAATVYSSGDVFWSRPGTLEVLCRFSGLVMFPFDTLSCPIEIGGWAHSGLVQGVLPSPSGCVTSATSTEEVAQNSYSEFWIKHTECSAHIYEYESYPGEFWPVLRFRVYLGRATMHYYAAFYVFPAGMLTVLSFSVFFLSFQTGERLGVGVTLVLMIEVAKVTMSENIPQCGEMLWLELFYLVNFLFTLGSLLESAVVLSLAYHDSDSLIPEAFLPSTWRLAFRSSVVRDTIVGSWEKRSRNAQLAASDLGTGVTLAARDVMTGLGTSQQLPRQRSPPNPADVSDDLQDVMITPRDERAVNEGDADGVSAAATLPRVPQPLQRCNVESLQSAAQEFEKKVSFGSAFSSSFVASRMKGISRQKSINNTNSIKQEDISRLIFFENLFFRLDIDGSSTISFDEMRRMLAFLALDMTADEVSTALVDADTDDSDGQLNRHEFINMCIKHLWHYPLMQLEAAATNFAEFRLARLRRTNEKWKRVALSVDMHARFWFPALYSASLVILLSIKISDNYIGVKPDGSFMDQAPLFQAMSFEIWQDHVITFWTLLALVFLSMILSVVFAVIVLPAKRRQRFIAAKDASQTIQDIMKHAAEMRKKRFEAIKLRASFKARRVDNETGNRTRPSIAARVTRIGRIPGTHDSQSRYASKAWGKSDARRRVKPDENENMPQVGAQSSTSVQEFGDES